MSLTISVAGTTIADAIPPSSVQATQMANDGEAGFGGFSIDDPGADILTVGHKPVVIEESECSQPRLFTGWTTQRDMGRSDERGMIVADDRLHDVTLVDMNAALRFRILRGADTKRPEETIDERMAWILGKPALSAFVTDTGYVQTGYTALLDEADYRGLTPGDVLDDLLGRRLVDMCYFAFWDPVAEEVGLYFGPQTEATTESDLSISNVISDINGTTVFAPDSEATLARKPDQVYSQVILRYREGTRKIYRERQSTATNYVDRGTTIDRPRTKKLATAESQAETFLTRHSQEVDTISCTIIVPPESAGLAVAGQRIDCKFSHLPGYTDWTSMRIVQSTISPVNDVANHYAIALELENPALGTAPHPVGDCPPPTPSTVFGPLNSGTSDANGNTLYLRPGIVYPVEPEPEFAGGWNFPAYGVEACDAPADGMGSNVQNTLRFIVSGGGTLTPEICAIGVNYWTALYYYDYVNGSSHVCPNGSIVGATFTVPNDEHCYHLCDITDRVTGIVEGMPEDFTQTPGEKIYWNSATWVQGEVDTEEDLEEAPFAPVESTVDPTADDDIGEGYYVGQLWLNSTNSYTYILIDNTEGAAVWTLITTGSPAWNFVTSDGTTTVDPTTELTFVGPTLTDLGSGVAELTFSTALDDLSDVNAPMPDDGDVLAWDDGASEWVNAAPGGSSQSSTINFIIDGGGSTISTGVKGDIRVDFACVVDAWALLADQTGSIVVDVWKDAIANFPPTDADSMCSGNEPTITTATNAEDSTITDWTTDDIAAGDVLRFNVDSCTDITRATLALKITRA